MKIFLAMAWVLTCSVHAATTFSCDGCSNSQYEALAKQTTGEVFVYDLVHNRLKRYDIVLITPAKDSPTGEDIKTIIHLTPAQADIDYIDKVSRLRRSADSVGGSTITYRADVSVANVDEFKDYSVYDIAYFSALQRRLGEHLLHGDVHTPEVKDAIEIINDVGGNIIKVILRHKVSVTFKVELSDGSEAVFVVDTNDIDGVPNFDIQHSSDADNNDVISGNNSSAVGGYFLTTQANLTSFLTYLQRIGVPVVQGGSTGVWGCEPTSTGVKCKFIK